MAFYNVSTPWPWKTNRSIFILIGAYLIMGVFVNYSKYGSTGIDVLPHSDTIRELPYLVSDWLKAVVRTFKDGNRGGYTSV